MQRSSVLTWCVLIALSLTGTSEAMLPLHYESRFMSIELAANQPAIAHLTLDSLGQGKFGLSPLRPLAAPVVEYRWRRKGSLVEYRAAGMSQSSPPLWSFEFSSRKIQIHSVYSTSHPPSPLVLNFDQRVNPATLLGILNRDGGVRLPAILHLPGQGTLRITSDTGNGPALGYDAWRIPEWPTAKAGPEGLQADGHIKVTIPAASAAMRKVDYTLQVVDIYPKVQGIEGDPRFDSFRRDWLNIFQLNPRRRLLANNSTSDDCAFTVFMYSSMAADTPPLARGLTALDLVWQTLDHYLSGSKSYGMAGYESQGNSLTSLDTYPSLLIAAGDYVEASGDVGWLSRNYPALKEWSAKMLAMIPTGGALLVDSVSGNSGIWDHNPAPGHSANWWDTIGFGHQDAHSNALAYHALQKMTVMARKANSPKGARLYASKAEKLRSVYFSTFYDPATGVLAGWRSADGKLHDYYFTFVNGAAITYGLIPPVQANKIMDHLLAKMKEVGHTHFEYGLPGNLIPIRQDDYRTRDKRWGASDRPDGSDGFEIYTDGGATACMSYFTIQALYDLGRRREADAILFPMLAAFERNEFQGRGVNGMTNDWKAWDGTSYGYEGFLVDGYQAFLAVLSR